MSHRTKWNFVAMGSLPLACMIALLSCPRYKDEDPSADQLTVWKGHQFPVQTLAFATDGTTVTAAAFPVPNPTGEVEVVVWDRASGFARATYTRPLGELQALTFASGAETLACAGSDGTVQLSQAALRQEPLRLDGVASQVCALAFSGNGKRLAGADHLHITLWDATTGQRLAAFQGQKQRAFALAFAPNVALLASGYGDGTVQLWDALKGEPRYILSGHDKPVFALAFTADGHLLASADFAGLVKLWDMASRTEWATFGKLGDNVAGVAFAPDGKTLAVAVGWTVELWDVGTRELVARLTGHEGKVKCLAFSPDGTRLASGGHDRTVRLWDVAPYREGRH
jgi:WD40 repeat protein